MDLAVDVLAVFGPTGSGKSAVAETLADALGTEIVSADAMQTYRGLPILTNQPQRPTRLVAIWPLSHEGSVGEYALLAQAAIDELVHTRGRAVVAGGTGLYLRAALADLELPPPPPSGARERWEAAYDSDPATTYDDLARSDPTVATVVHPNDRRRVVRALELAEAGSSLSPTQDRLWAGKTRRPTLVLGLEVDSGGLHARIEKRTTEMFERGVAEEVQAVLAGPISRTAQKALGLRELAELDAGEAYDAIVRRTVRYAAYQRKWMRRIPDIVLVDGDRPPEEVAGGILDLARAR